MGEQTGQGPSDYQAAMDKFLQKYGKSATDVPDPIGSKAGLPHEVACRDFSESFRTYKIALESNNLTESQKTEFEKEAVEFSKNNMSALAYLKYTNPEAALAIEKVAQAQQKQLEFDQNRNTGLTR